MAKNVAEPLDQFGNRLLGQDARQALNNCGQDWGRCQSGLAGMLVLQQDASYFILTVLNRVHVGTSPNQIDLRVDSVAVRRGQQSTFPEDDEHCGAATKYKGNLLHTAYIPFDIHSFEVLYDLRRQILVTKHSAHRLA